MDEVRVKSPFRCCSLLSFSLSGTGELVQLGRPPLLAAAASEGRCGGCHAGWDGRDGWCRGWIRRGRQYQEDFRQGPLVVRAHNVKMKDGRTNAR